MPFKNSLSPSFSPRPRPTSRQPTLNNHSNISHPKFQPKSPSPQTPNVSAGHKTLSSRPKRRDLASEHPTPTNEPRTTIHNVYPSPKRRRPLSSLRNLSPISVGGELRTQAKSPIKLALYPVRWRRPISLGPQPSFLLTRNSSYSSLANHTPCHPLYEANMTRLGIDELRKPSKVMGTAYGLGYQEIREVERLSIRDLKRTAGLVTRPVYEFLHDCVDFNELGLPKIV